MPEEVGVASPKRTLSDAAREKSRESVLTAPRTAADAGADAKPNGKESRTSEGGRTQDAGFRSRHRESGSGDRSRAKDGTDVQVDEFGRVLRAETSGSESEDSRGRREGKRSRSAHHEENHRRHRHERSPGRKYPDRRDRSPNRDYRDRRDRSFRRNRERFDRRDGSRWSRTSRSPDRNRSPHHSGGFSRRSKSPSSSNAKAQEPSHYSGYSKHSKDQNASSSSIPTPSSYSYSYTGATSVSQSYPYPVSSSSFTSSSMPSSFPSQPFPQPYPYFPYPSIPPPQNPQAFYGQLNAGQLSAHPATFQPHGARPAGLSIPAAHASASNPVNDSDAYDPLSDFMDSELNLPSTADRRSGNECNAEDAGEPGSAGRATAGDAIVADRGTNPENGFSMSEPSFIPNPPSVPPAPPFPPLSIPSSLTPLVSETISLPAFISSSDLIQLTSTLENLINKNKDGDASTANASGGLNGYGYDDHRIDVPEVKEDENPEMELEKEVKRSEKEEAPTDIKGDNALQRRIKEAKEDERHGKDGSKSEKKEKKDDDTNEHDWGIETEAETKEEEEEEVEGEEEEDEEKGGSNDENVDQGKHFKEKKKKRKSNEHGKKEHEGWSGVTSTNDSEAEEDEGEASEEGEESKEGKESHEDEESYRDDMESENEEKKEKKKEDKKKRKKKKPKSSDGKESEKEREERMMIIFRKRLAFHVKEELKESWKKKEINKEKYKLIARKSCDKIVSSLQPHQVPNSISDIKKYFSNFRKKKIATLVNGYVEKYKK